MKINELHPWDVTYRQAVAIQLALKERLVLSDEDTFPRIANIAGADISYAKKSDLFFASLRHTPDCAIFDGQGIAHPRGMGLASHMGIILGVPAIGCAKKRLVGCHDEVGCTRGDYTALTLDEQIVGAVLRTKAKVKPVFISPGHKISLKNAVEVVLSCCRGYKLPEPVRLAHLAVNRLRVSHGDPDGG